MVKINIVEFTPEMAREAREKTNFQNRKFNKNWVRTLANEMLDGKFKLNGETIKFDKEGNLIDGNNRLKALELSGETNPSIKVPFIVVEGVEREDATTIDVGMKRVLEHHLQFMSTCYEKGSAAIVRQFINLNNHRLSQGASTTTLKYTNTEMVDVYKHYEQQFGIATNFAKSIKKANKALNESEVGGIYMHLVYTLNYPSEVVRDFFDRLCSFRQSDKSIYRITSEELSNKKTCRGGDRIIVYMRCWNAMMAGNRSNRPQYTQGMWFKDPITE